MLWYKKQKGHQGERDRDRAPLPVRPFFSTKKLYTVYSKITNDMCILMTIIKRVQMCS